jgi:hypothetical protein
VTDRPSFEDLAGLIGTLTAHRECLDAAELDVRDHAAKVIAASAAHANAKQRYDIIKQTAQRAKMDVDLAIDLIAHSTLAEDMAQG